jgi:hypothetical protein
MVLMYCKFFSDLINKILNFILYETTITDSNNIVYIFHGEIFDLEVYREKLQYD